MLYLTTDNFLWLVSREATSFSSAIQRQPCFRKKRSNPLPLWRTISSQEPLWVSRQEIVFSRWPGSMSLWAVTFWKFLSSTIRAGVSTEAEATVPAPTNREIRMEMVNHTGESTESRFSLPLLHYREIPVVWHTRKCKAVGFPSVQTIQKMYPWLNH